MRDTEFHALAASQYQAIEDGIEASGVDIDYETNGGVLTLTFPNRSKIIIVITSYSIHYTKLYETPHALGALDMLQKEGAKNGGK